MAERSAQKRQKCLASDQAVMPPRPTAMTAVGTGRAGRPTALASGVGAGTGSSAADASDAEEAEARVVGGWAASAAVPFVRGPMDTYWKALRSKVDPPEVQRK